MPSQIRERQKLTFARQMRKEMTPEERKLWYMYLRVHPYYRFRRQEIIGPYIADFYCSHAKLVIEIDGSQHFEPAARIYDEKRTAFFHQQNLRVIRFTNADINQRFRSVCETVEHALKHGSANKE